MERNSNRNADAQSVKSHASKAPSMTQSMREEAAEKAYADAEDKKHQERLAEVRKSYTSIIDKDRKVHQSSIVGLNPNQKPSYAQTKKTIFPMQGLWTQKSLMVTQNQKHGISAQEQNDFCKETNKAHFKKMYEQKEYMEEYLKFKEVIAGMKK